MGNLGFTLHAVQVTMVARKDDAEARQVRTKLKSGTTTADRTTRPMASCTRPIRIRPWHARFRRKLQ
jgi:hypothetical protein